MSSFLSVVFFVGLTVIEGAGFLVVHASGMSAKKRGSALITMTACVTIAVVGLWLNPARGTSYEQTLDFVKWFAVSNMIIVTAMIIWALVAANLTTRCGTTPTSH